MRCDRDDAGKVVEHLAQDERRAKKSIPLAIPQDVGD